MSGFGNIFRIFTVIFFVTQCVYVSQGDLRVLFAPDPPEKVTTSPTAEVQALVDKVTDRLKCVQHGMNQLDCVQCLKTDRIMRMLGINGSSSTMTSRNAQDLAMLFLHHILNFRTLCSAQPPGCSDFIGCQWQLMNTIRSPDILDSLEGILRQVKQVLEPDAAKTCFSAESILEELNITSGVVSVSETDIRRIVSNMMGHIFEGHCINVGESVTDFLDDLFHVYGEKCSSLISAKGLKQIVEALQNGGTSGHENHDHSHDHHQEKHDHSNCDHHHDHNHLDHDHDHSDHSHSDNDHSHHDHGHDHDHDHDHDDHDVTTQISRIRRFDPSEEYSASTSETAKMDDESRASSEGTKSDAESTGQKSSVPLESVHNSEGTPASSLKSDLSHSEKQAESFNKIHEHTEDLRRFYIKKFGGLKKDESTPSSYLEAEPHEHISLATKCLSVEELMSKFGHLPNSTLSQAEFLQLCPALVQQIVSGVCKKPLVPGKRPSDFELYGYSSLAVLIITLTSLAGVFLLPILTKSVYHYVMNGFIGLAFSTLAGDALLHLIPQALGIHTHDDNAPHSHDHSGGVLESVEPYVWKQLGIIAAIYFLFLFEAITCVFNRDKDDGHNHGSKGHGHSHVPDNLPKELTLVSVKTKSESSTQLAFSRHQSETSLDTEIAEIEDSKPPEPIITSKTVFLGLTSVAFVVTLGDSLHNFGDGLAIGAAFSSGIRGGLSTSIAVFCHELPHEFGDFVILLSTGLSFSKALLINFISGLTCFIGLYIGIQLGDNETARAWIMALTAGIFLYVALVEMLPELKEHNKGRPGAMLVVKNVGVLAGVAIMLIISIYEERFYI